MEEFVFAGNRRRWKYLRPLFGAALFGVGVWSGTLCWALLKSPTLPNLGLAAAEAAAPGLRPGGGEEAQAFRAGTRPE